MKGCFLFDRIHDRYVDIIFVVLAAFYCAEVAGYWNYLVIPIVYFIRYSMDTYLSDWVEVDAIHQEDDSLL